MASSAGMQAGHNLQTPPGIRIFLTTEAVVSTRPWAGLAPWQAMGRIAAAGARRWELSLPPSRSGYGLANWADHHDPVTFTEALVHVQDAIGLTCEGVCHRLVMDRGDGLLRTLALARALGASRIICRLHGDDPALIHTHAPMLARLCRNESIPVLIDSAGALSAVPPAEQASLVRDLGLRVCLDLGEHISRGGRPEELMPLLPAVDFVHLRHALPGWSQLPIDGIPAARSFRWWIEELHRLGCRSPYCIDFASDRGVEPSTIHRAVLALRRLM